MIADRQHRDRRRPLRDEPSAVAERSAGSGFVDRHDARLERQRRCERILFPGVTGRPDSVERETGSHGVEPRAAVKEDPGGVREVNDPRSDAGGRQRRDARFEDFDLSRGPGRVRVLRAGEVAERPGDAKPGCAPEEIGDGAELPGRKTDPAHAGVELQVNRQRFRERPRGLDEESRLPQVVKGRYKPVRAQRPCVGRIGVVEQQDLPSDSRAAQRDPLLGHRDGEARRAFESEPPGHPRRSVAVGVPLDHAEEPALRADAVSQEPVIARDRVHGDRGDRRPAVHGRRMPERRRPRKAARRIRTTRAACSSSSRTSCGPGERREGNRRSVRFAVSR